MQIQVNATQIDVNKVLHIFGEAVEDIRKCEDERGRKERIRQRHFALDTRDKSTQKYVIWFLHDQRATEGCKTFGEARQAIVGTRVNIQKKYQVFDQ